MVKILTLGRENGILVQLGMDFARGACLFGSLAHLSGPCVAQILLRSLMRKYQDFRGVLIKFSISSLFFFFFFTSPGLPVMSLVLSVTQKGNS